MITPSLSLGLVKARHLVIWLLNVTYRGQRIVLGKSQTNVQIIFAELNERWPFPTSNLRKLSKSLENFSPHLATKIRLHMFPLELELNLEFFGTLGIFLSSSLNFVPKELGSIFHLMLLAMPHVFDFLCNYHHIFIFSFRQINSE